MPKRSRRLTAFLLSLALLLLLPAPAHAGTTRFDILASAAQTATAQGGAISVSGIKELTVYLSCTASSGTGETIDVYLQSSSDGGITWFDLPFVLGQRTSATGTENASTTNKRDFLELAADVACSGEKTIAKYDIFGDQIRAGWVIAGTTPSYTFGIKAIGKS